LLVSAVVLLPHAASELTHATVISNAAILFKFFFMIISSLTELY